MSSLFENMHAWLTAPGIKAATRNLDYFTIDKMGTLPRLALHYRAFHYFKPEHTQVVIIGSEPSSIIGKSNGLAFGVDRGFDGDPWSGALGDIRSELLRTTGQRLTDPTLESWAEQGVLLLNTCLTVSEGRPQSHSQVGWQAVVDAALLHVLRSGVKPIFLLWGKDIQPYAELAQSYGCTVYTGRRPEHFEAIDWIQWGDSDEQK